MRAKEAEEEGKEEKEISLNRGGSGRRSSRPYL
jgi:hypothetical protein